MQHVEKVMLRSKSICSAIAFQIWPAQNGRHFKTFRKTGFFFKENLYTLIQVSMTWFIICYHNLHQRWPSSTTSKGIARLEWVNTLPADDLVPCIIMLFIVMLTHLPPGQIGCHFTDDIFKCILLNEKFCIFIEISLQFVPKGPIDNNPALV